MSAGGAPFEIAVRPPYRLDLTATVLRRLSTNIVDVFDGRTYRRLIGDPLAPAVLAVEQVAPDTLRAEVAAPLGAPADRAQSAALVRRMLGTEVDLGSFYAASATVGWLAPLVVRARGVRPPRYPSLWEAIVNAVVYQQVSIHAAGAIVRRAIERFGTTRAVGGVQLATFVTPAAIAAADPAELRAVGLSANKVAALQQLARDVGDGGLAEAALGALPTPELIAALVEHRGIGPWTAAVVALRGFGRLDIFPLNDSGVARSVRNLAGHDGVDLGAVLAALGPQRGMLYYHLLLGRLAARGEIELP